MSDNQATNHGDIRDAIAGDIAVGRCHRILFVCNQGRIRSRTAAELYAANPDLETRCAGVDPMADRKLSRDDLLWADRVFVFEKRQRNIIHKNYPDLYAVKPIECLYIEDEYDYGSPDLMALLELRLRNYPG